MAVECPDPKVSVIVPVYNTEQWLARCLDSIVAQTMTDWECIIIDDGSTDGSRKIMDQYAVADPRIKIVTQDNAGVSMARNRGLDFSRGEWVTFVDSDDYIDADALSIVSDLLIREDIGMLIMGYVEEFKNSAGISQEGARRYSHLPDWALADCIGDRLYTLDRNNAARLLFDASASYWGYIRNWFRRAAIEEYCLRFDSALKYNEDRLFSFEYLARMDSSMGSIVINRPLYKYCIRHDSAMNKRFSIRFLDDIHAFDRMILIGERYFGGRRLNAMMRQAALQRKYFLTWAAMNAEAYSPEVEQILESAERRYLTWTDMLPPYHEYTMLLLKRWAQNRKYRLKKLFLNGR